MRLPTVACLIPSYRLSRVAFSSFSAFSLILPQAKVIALIIGSGVYAHDIAFTQDGIFVGYAMDDHVVYGNTSARGKSAVTEKRGCGTLFLDIVADNSVYLEGGYAWAYRLTRSA